MKKVLVLFTCFNRLEKTKKCVETLKKENLDIHFIVVDDDSKDGTAEYLKNQEKVYYIKGNGNLFYTQGMRVAISYAKNLLSKEKYDYVMLINDDVQFYDKAVEKLIAYLGNEQAIMVGATCDEKGKLCYSAILRASKFRPKYKHVMSNNEEKIKCDTLNANCVLMPRDLFIALDNMDGHYHHSFGDYDYGFEASRKGYAIYPSNFFVGFCKDDHPISGSWQDRNLSRKKRWQLKESPTGNPTKIWFYYLKKNYNIFTAIIYTLNDIIKVWVR